MSNLATLTPRLGKLIPLLGSDRDGEVIGAARAIDRLLKSAGRDWHDLAALLRLPAPRWEIAADDWQSVARFCAENSTRLTERELDFLATLASWRGRPTEKQFAWLRKIAARLRGEQ
jgi:hypothetical protein